MLHTIFSKQKWLINSIPTKKVDNNDLVKTILFKVVTNFIENEKGLEKVLWDQDEGHKKVLEELMKIYEWITEHRPLLINIINQMEDNFPKIEEHDSLWKFVNNNHIGEIIKLKEKLLETDQNILKDIINIREYLIVI